MINSSQFCGHTTHDDGGGRSVMTWRFVICSGKLLGSQLPSGSEDNQNLPHTAVRNKKMRTKFWKQPPGRLSERTENEIRTELIELIQTNFDILLTVHLNLFILILTNLMH